MLASAAPTESPVVATFVSWQFHLPGVSLAPVECRLP